MPSRRNNTKISWYLFMIFFFLSLGIGTSGYFYYKSQKEYAKSKAEQELLTIADLKRDQIDNWRKERMSLVTMPSRSPFVAIGIKEFLKDPSNSIKRERVLHFISSFKETYGFQNIFLIDSTQNVLLSTQKGNILECPHFKRAVSESFRKSQVILTDLHRVEKEGRIHIGAMTPIKDPDGGTSTPIALLVFEVDPYQFLYPLIQSWPVRSQTAETLLVRQEGDEVVFLNELRHLKNTALNLRLSIHEEQLPAAMAVRSRQGIVEGVDYRGVPVVAVIRQIPDSSWFLIAKVDLEEIYEPIHKMAKTIGMVVALLILGTGAIIALLWTQQQAQYFRRQAEVELQHQILRQRFEYLSQYANDMIIMADQDLKIVEVNERSLSGYGYGRDELIGRDMLELSPPETRGAFEEQIRQINQFNGLIYETLHQKKDQTLFPVEISSRLIEWEGKKYYQSIIRDITERKRAEENIQKAYSELSAIYQNVPILMIIVDQERKIRRANRAASEFANRSIGEMEGLRGGEAFRCLHALSSSAGCGYGPFCETCTIRQVILETFKTGRTYSGIEAKLPILIGEKEEEKWFLINTSFVRLGDQSHVLVCLQDITELKQTGGKLQDTVEVFQTFINTNPETALLIDERGAILIANDTLVERLGKKKEEIIGSCLYEILEQDVARRRKSFIDQVFQTGKPVQFEDMRKDRYYKTFVHPIFDPQGKVRKASIWGIDITSTKLAEKDYRERALRFQTYSNLLSELIQKLNLYEKNLKENFQTITALSSQLLNTERASIWLYNDDYSQIRCFDLYERSKGSHREGETLQASEFPQYTASHKIGQVIAAEDVWKDPRTSHIPSEYFRASGIRSLLDAPVWVGGKLVALLSFEHVGQKRKWLPEEEQIAMALAAYVSNCLEADERRRAEALLRESEEKYRFLIEHAGEAIFVAQNEKLKFVNSKTLEMIRYSREELTSKPFIEFIHLEDRALVLENHRKRLRGESLPSSYTFRIIQRSGDILWAELNTALIEWEGKPATLNFLTDITARKKAEQEMALLQEQLRQSQKLEAIGRLAGGIAHDFNNVLTVIKGISQLSLLQLQEDDPLRANLEEIEKAADKAANLTRQLLAFSRKQVMEMKVLDLNEVIRGLEKMLRRILGEDVELLFLLPEGIGRVKADPGQIEQVIINIVVNARDAMPEGGKLTIETANVELDEEYAKRHIAVRPGSYVMLSVSDTGIGMTAEVRERIFEPFFTTKERGKGTGLGLSTVYGIVKQSGGNIWVYSEPGQGATFKIYLPRVEEAAEDIKREVFGEIPRGDETVLVVEDEEIVRKLAVRILKGLGYKVLEASDGGKALILCEEYQDPIHLILTDVVMPGMSGRKLVERLKVIHPEAKVLYMSGYTDNVIVHHGILEERIEFIQKPFTLESLARKVRRVLDS